MTTAQLAQRLERIEARRQPPVQVVICWCPTDAKHLPGCSAAGDGDHVIMIHWEDSGNGDD